MTRAVIISDIHIGSRFFLHEPFFRFMGNLPPDCELVLNGDTVDCYTKGFTDQDETALQMIRSESSRRQVTWIRGNHDEDYIMEDPRGISFAREYFLRGRIYIAHGHDFDNVMPRNRLFMKFFRTLHHLRIAIGAESVHVAYYAKKFPLLYNVLRNRVMGNAVEHALENNFPAIACGHTHYPDDRSWRGVRYINTGSWTEPNPRFILVTDSGITLHSMTDGIIPNRTA